MVEVQTVKVSTPSILKGDTIVHSVLMGSEPLRFIGGKPCAEASNMFCYEVEPGYYFNYTVDGYTDSRGLLFSLHYVNLNEYGISETVKDVVTVETTLSDLLSVIEDPGIPLSLNLFLLSLPRIMGQRGEIPDPSIRFPKDEIDRVKGFMRSLAKSSAKG